MDEYAYAIWRDGSCIGLSYDDDGAFVFNTDKDARDVCEALVAHIDRIVARIAAKEESEPKPAP